jgi:hypothetical protein
MAQKFGIVAKIAQKPTEFPERLLGAVQPPNEGLPLRRFRFQNHKAEFEKRLLWLPTEESAINPNQEEPFEKIPVIGLPGMQAWDMADHEFTSFVWAYELSLQTRLSRFSFADFESWLMKASTISRLAPLNFSVPQKSAA